MKNRPVTRLAVALATCAITSVAALTLSAPAAYASEYSYYSYYCDVLHVDARVQDALHITGSYCGVDWGDSKNPKTEVVLDSRPRQVGFLCDDVYPSSDMKTLVATGCQPVS
ncbi:hypothetical protein [Streptomyces zagrosensis]|uniref:Secreted protein n=1 Tax=Streptomyces zagrosensis TaxID=1042984 RepID=A0A7W9V2M4_9ACTN|nr:hypothetical protein [Streptomyces zagrosensis]MBB5939014.1 hypothetical protein [Streptomyces zagrosensis]